MENGNPDPDLFLAALEYMDCPPASQCLVLEDAINGIEAAKRAGMNVIRSFGLICHNYRS